MTVTLFHNPNCSTSRQVLEMIREAGVEPLVVDYLKTGWTVDGLTALFAEMGVRPHQVVRTRNTDAEARGLSDAATPDAVVIAAMVADPVLVERPIVRAPGGAALCRPKDRVLDLLRGGGRA